MFMSEILDENFDADEILELLETLKTEAVDSEDDNND